MNSVTVMPMAPPALTDGGRPKTVLVTAYDRRMRSFGKITSAAAEAYCDGHGIDFLCCRQFRPNSPAQWQKLDFILRGFAAGYSRVIWMDADVLITNPAKAPWKRMDTGIHVSRDWTEDATEDSHFSAAVIVVNLEAATVINYAQSHQESLAPFQLNSRKALRDTFLADDHFRRLFTIHERAELNPVPDYLPQKAVSPWQPEDWVCHFTMLPPNERYRRIKATHQSRAVRENWESKSRPDDHIVEPAGMVKEGLTFNVTESNLRS